MTENRESTLRLAILGIGSIGSYLLEAIRAGKAGRAEVVAIADVREQEPRLRELAAGHGCAWETDPLRLASHQPQLVVEAASQEVVRQYAIRLLEQGLDLLVMSVGALADEPFGEKVREALERTGRRLYLPSGAIGGLDVVRAAALDRLDEVRLITSKPPRALAGAPYLVEHGMNLEGIRARTVIFRGPALEAVKAFPQNVNVAAALSLAGLGAEKTEVEVVADPNLDRNVHEIYARGSFGELQLKIANVPSPSNPKTSFLACLSPLALLRRLSDKMTVGS